MCMYILARHIHYNIDIRKRLSFANGYLNFDFSHVIFSDECCVYIGPERKRVTSFVFTDLKANCERKHNFQILV